MTKPLAALTDPKRSRLAVVVDFAQADLDKLTKRDREKLVRSLAPFLDGAEDYLRGKHDEVTQRLRSLQEIAVTNLRPFAAASTMAVKVRRSGGAVGERPFGFGSVLQKLDNAHLEWRENDEGKPVLSVRGEPNDVFLFQLLNLLATAPAVEYLRLCDAEDCGSIFLSSDIRKTFCSARCKTRIATRNLRAGLKVEVPRIRRRGTGHRGNRRGS